jgi:hypothetical protein
MPMPGSSQRDRRKVSSLKKNKKGKRPVRELDLEEEV